MPSHAAPPLQYLAGSKALERLRSGGFGPRDLEAFILPATGPRWLIAPGFDRALLANGWLRSPGHTVLMLGASAGAWRALALAAPDPETTYAALIESYCKQRFTFADDPPAISAAYRTLLSDVFSNAAMEHALAHPSLDVAIIAARARRSERLEHRRTQQLFLGAAALVNYASPRSSDWFFERTIFHARHGRANAHPLANALQGTHAPLTANNVHAAALASGSVPLYMQPVTNIADAPPGAYLDGGLTDYHLNQTLALERGVALLFLHQPKVIAAWLDQYVPWRRADPQRLANVLLVHPSPAFVQSLPGSAVPSRHDFTTFVNEPSTRFARWQRAVDLSSALGDAFLEDVASGAIARRVQPL